MSAKPKDPEKPSSIGGCERCGRPVVLSKFTLCYECRAEEKAEVERTLDYLKTHRGATLSQVAEAVKVDPQLVLRLIRGGRMEVVAQERLKKARKSN
jgi:hypothetical protein